MPAIRTVTISIVLVCLSLLVTGCEPEVGSKAWCEKLEKKPKADWTFTEARDYAEHCIF